MNKMWVKKQRLVSWLLLSVLCFVLVFDDHLMADEKTEEIEQETLGENTESKVLFEDTSVARLWHILNGQESISVTVDSSTIAAKWKLPIYDILKAFLSSAVYHFAKEKPLSSMLFLHALWGEKPLVACIEEGFLLSDGSLLPVGNIEKKETTLANQLLFRIMSEQNLTEKLQEIVSDNVHESTFVFVCIDPDLKYSVLHMICHCKRQADKSGCYEVHITDIYDFTEFMSHSSSEEKMAVLLNNFGYLLQKARVLSPFSIDLSFRIVADCK